MGVGESLLQVGANLINFCCYQRQHGTGDRQWAYPKLADAIRTLGRTAIELRGICLVFLQQLPNKLIDREFISEPVETISLMKQRGILTRRHLLAIPGPDLCHEWQVVDRISALWRESRRRSNTS